MTHVHDTSPADWSFDQMRRHLWNEHGEISPPMFWDLGKLHQLHLSEHQKPAESEETCQAYFGLGGNEAATCQRPAGHPPISEDGIGHSPARIPIQEKPVPEPRPHSHGGSVTDWHSNTDRRSLAYHLHDDHGVPTTQIDVREVYSQHIALHAGQTDADQVEFLARNLYSGDADGPQPDWDDLGQEERDRYRDKARVNLAAVREARGAEQIAAERKEREADRGILLDRVICAMSGLDFDTEWAADSGIGPNARGALRLAHREPALKVLGWLERGGLGDLGMIEQRLVDERDEALAAGRASEAKVRELQAQMREQQRGMQDQASAVAEAESLVHDLEEVNNDLRAQLRLLTEERDRLDGQLTTALGLGAEAEAEKAQALEAVMAAQAKAALLRDERDTFQRANAEQARMIHEKNALLARVNEALDQANAQLEAEIAQRVPDVSTAPEEPVRVFIGDAELSDIRELTVDTVGRARAAVEVRRAAKAFRADSVMLFTRDAVANMLDRLADDLEK